MPAKAEGIKQLNISEKELEALFYYINNLKSILQKDHIRKMEEILDRIKARKKIYENDIYRMLEILSIYCRFDDHILSKKQFNSQSEMLFFTENIPNRQVCLNDNRNGIILYQFYCYIQSKRNKLLLHMIRGR